MAAVCSVSIKAGQNEQPSIFNCNRHRHRRRVSGSRHTPSLSSVNPPQLSTEASPSISLSDSRQFFSPQFMNPLNPQNPKTQTSKSLKHNAISFFNSALIPAITVTALSLFHLHFPLKPAVASVASPPPLIEMESKPADDGLSEPSESSPDKVTATKDESGGAILAEESGIAGEEQTKAEIKYCEHDSGSEREKALEGRIQSKPDDVEALRNLTEIYLENRKFVKALSLTKKLIELQPEELQWPLLKAHIYLYNGKLKLARNGFYEVVSKHPFCIKAYQGLISATAKPRSKILMNELRKIEKIIEDAMIKCNNESRRDYLMREFRFLIAQIRVIEGKYDGALEIYEEMIKENRRDFRPYLSRGMVYTMLGRKDKAEKSFKKYKKLVPEDCSEELDKSLMAFRAVSMIPKEEVQ